jgi:hypothetical protein
MLLETEAGIWARADATVFRLLMNHDRTGRRMQAAARTIASAYRRVEALRRRTQAADTRDHAKAAREVEREFAAAWGKLVRVRVPRRVAAFADKSKNRTGAGSRALPTSTTPRRAIRAYKAPLLDTRGRIALYFRIRYVGFKSKNWRPGLAADHALYILREAALENGEVALDLMPLSNMGRDPEEIAACWRALEAMEEGYRANAKVQYRIVWNLPHGLNPEERRELVEDFCRRTFGRLGLPWVAAVHEPDARGDQRNYHAHICFSTRPCERLADHEWAIALEKVNGLTDADGLKLMRALAAGHMNNACRAAELTVRFTHQTYEQRGIDAERQKHIGPAAMAAYERGEPVAAIERNTLVVERNELAVARDAAQREAALIDRLVAALATMADLTAQRQRANSAILAARHIGAQARQITQRLRLRQPLRVPAKALVTTLSTAADRLATGKLDSGQRRKEMSLARDRLDHIRQQIAARKATATEERKRAACGRLLQSPVRPYRIENGRATLDLSAMAKDDASLVLTLDRETMVSTLRERIRRDRELDAADARARARAVEDQHAAEDRRRRQIEEACRILREAPKRPYRCDGNVIRPDLSAVNQSERDTILSAGLTDGRVEAALRARIKRDQAADALTAMLTAIEAERIFVFSDETGCTIGEATRQRFGIPSATVSSAEVQKRLEAIADRQRAEIEPVAIHASNHAEHIVNEAGGWTLSAQAPEHLRRAADAWRHERQLQQAFADVAATLPVVVAKEQTLDAQRLSPPAPIASIKRQRLIAAASQRESLMAGWAVARALNPSSIVERGRTPMTADNPGPARTTPDWRAIARRDFSR